MPSPTNRSSPGLQIERCAPLLRLSHTKYAGHSPYGRIVVARGLAFRTLDFDDARAGVGKGNGAEGCRHGLLNRNDQQPPRVSRRDNLREGQTFR